MKKIVIINIVLLILFLILPKKEIEIKKEDIIENVQLISSRSMKRDKEIVVEQTTIKNKPLSISSNGINLIKKYEGLNLNSYRLEGETNYTIRLSVIVVVM